MEPLAMFLNCRTPTMSVEKRCSFRLFIGHCLDFGAPIRNLSNKQPALQLICIQLKFNNMKHQLWSGNSKVKEKQLFLRLPQRWTPIWNNEKQACRGRQLPRLRCAKSYLASCFTVITHITRTQRKGHPKFWNFWEETSGQSFHWLTAKSELFLWCSNFGEIGACFFGAITVGNSHCNLRMSKF